MALLQFLKEYLTYVKLRKKCVLRKNILNVTMHFLEGLWIIDTELEPDLKYTIKRHHLDDIRKRKYYLS